MKWNERDNFRQIVRNYENNDNIFYFVLVNYLYILVIIVKYSIRKYLAQEDVCYYQGLLLGKLVGDIC